MFMRMRAKHTSPSAKQGQPLPQSKSRPLRRILVVHDDGDLRELSVEVLIRSGYKVDAVTDSETAWQALIANPYDLVITDHKNPRVSGVELLKKLHAVQKALPAIVAAPSLPMEELAQYPSLQPTATLLMPYSVEEFLSTVHEVLRVTADAPGQRAPRPIRQSQPSTEQFQLL
jgi:DNA-binding NtrC family response regulator